MTGLLTTNPRRDATSAFGPGAGLVESQALLLLIERLDEELVRQEKEWAPIDEEIDSIIGRVAPKIPLGPVHPSHYHPGGPISALKLPPEYMPAVSVTSYRATPNPESRSLDLRTVFNVMLGVEAYVAVKVPGVARTGSREIDRDDTLLRVATETATARASERFGSAIYGAIMSDYTLGGITPCVEKEAQFNQSEPWHVRVQPDDRDAGELWTYQGIRVDFTVRRYADVPGIMPVPGVLPRGYRP
jgi:hypothetical protein